MAERYFQRVPEFLKVVESLPPQNRYSEHLEAFIACCRAMGLFGQTLEWNDLWESPRQTYPQFGGVSAAELFNMLVAKLRENCLSEQTKEQARRRRDEAEARADDYESYADALRGETKRLVVLRIDLEYRKEFRDQISVVEALADLNHFINNQRNNSLFKGKLGYISKLEFGVLKGLHFHLILFFDGAIKDGRKDVYLAQKIGEYWVKVITKGRGCRRSSFGPYYPKILNPTAVARTESSDGATTQKKPRNNGGGLPMFGKVSEPTQTALHKIPGNIGSKNRNSCSRIFAGVAV